MGKNFYCEYCDKSFRDVLAVRKNHLNGALHQQLKKDHYDKFRDIKTFLQEEGTRQPCPRLLKNIDCNFGSRCRFTHYMPWELIEIEEQHKMALEKNSVGTNPHLEWKYNELQLHHNNSLPPSLQRWREESFKADVVEWGK